ncbi:zinc finger protein CO3-like [Lolium rigidum]|uniref:zinc finger protein CO3-like n=1 Tax=Lolium rigidum TaxID=89674 RepID=UPI001F5C9A64|nr:zinc finger protein CO3-like [Lolium rigidum]
MANGGGGGRRRKGARRAKPKKKTKYLSLSRHLSQAAEVVHRSESLSVEESLPLEAPSAEETLEEDGAGHEQQQQLDPFALHPEAPSTLFAAAPSLNDILGVSSPFSGGGSGGSSSCAPSPDASGGSGRFEGEEEDLARRALRGRERWVYCRSSSSSPSAATATTTTTTTTSSSCSSAASTGAASARPPLLKLDYDEILAAWAGRGSLYIGAAPALAPPKLEPDSVLVEVAPGRQAAAWVAPDATGRAERVRRYKEKRHARLFSKRIRYEVRRINAVRRPRLKGRFIRGNEGVAMAT